MKTIEEVVLAALEDAKQRGYTDLVLATLIKSRLTDEFSTIAQDHRNEQWTRAWTLYVRAKMSGDMIHAGKAFDALEILAGNKR